MSASDILERVSNLFSILMLGVILELDALLLDALAGWMKPSSSTTLVLGFLAVAEF